MRGSDPEEDERQDLSVWSRHPGDTIFVSNLIHRMDNALFLFDALVEGKPQFSL